MVGSVVSDRLGANVDRLGHILMQALPTASRLVNTPVSDPILRQKLHPQRVNLLDVIVKF